MYFVFRVVLSFLFLFVVPVQAGATQWSEYSEFMNQFYYLDNQKLNSITCDVVVSTINNSLAQIQSQLKPLHGKIEIIENLSDFKLNFSKKEGFSFNLPTFNIRIISEEEIADQARVEAGIKMMKDGMKHQINGAVEMLKGLFESYKLPKENDMKIIQITKEKDGTRIIYEKDGNKITNLYSGNTLKSKQIGPALEALSNERYKKLKDKLIIESADSDINQAGNNMHVGISIDYQDIKDIVFPSRIITKYKFIMQDMQQQATIEIMLQECKLD